MTRDELIAWYLPQVRGMAFRIGRAARWNDIDELEGQGLLVLVKVAEKYLADPLRETIPWGSYAGIRVRCGILEFIRKDTHWFSSTKKRLFSESRADDVNDIPALADRRTERERRIREDREVVDSGLRGMTPNHRRALDLYLQSFTLRESASVLGVSEGDVVRLRYSGVLAIRQKARSGRREAVAS